MLTLRRNHPRCLYRRWKKSGNLLFDILTSIKSSVAIIKSQFDSWRSFFYHHRSASLSACFFCVCLPPSACWEMRWWRAWWVYWEFVSFFYCFVSFSFFFFFAVIPAVVFGKSLNVAECGFSVDVGGGLAVFSRREWRPRRRFPCQSDTRTRFNTNRRVWHLNKVQKEKSHHGNWTNGFHPLFWSVFSN